MNGDRFAAEEAGVLECVGGHEGDLLLGVEPTRRIPYLAQVLGERITPADGQVYLAALGDVERAQTAMEQFHPVAALSGSLMAHENVLVPRSQPLINLLRTAMERMTDDLPEQPAILDMGCGSGCCALLAAQVWPQAAVLATDHLPEAAATAKINTGRFEALQLVRSGAVTVAEPGDLFETVGEASFDLIIFNAPWVTAPARNRMETALNDGGQQTVQRFLHGAATRLKPGGRVLLGYADHSGPNAIARLERFIGDAGLIQVHKHTNRIKTHRSKRAWESIIAYDLRLGESR